jgi:hypothetical protein
MHGLDKNEISAVIILCLLVVLTLVEMALSYWEDRHYYKTRDTFTNIYLTSLAIVTNLIVKGFFILGASLHRPLLPCVLGHARNAPLIREF